MATIRLVVTVIMNTNELPGNSLLRLANIKKLMSECDSTQMQL